MAEFQSPSSSSSPPPPPTDTLSKSETIEHICGVSTVAGVQDWALAKDTFSRLFWLILVIVGTVCTVWQMREMIVDYLLPENSFQTVVSSRSEFTRPFPKFTLCNFNRINASKAAERGLEPDAFTLTFADVFPSSYHMPFSMVDIISGVNDTRQRYQQKYENSSLRFMDAAAALGHDCERTVLKLAVTGHAYENVCKNVRESVTGFGRCFIFDYSSIFQTMPGVVTGLKLILNPALHQYLHNVVINNYADEGMLIDIGYASEYLPSAPVVLRPGTHSYISLSVQRREFQQEKFPLRTLPCRRDPRLSMMTGDYTRRMCYYDSVLNKTVNECGCVTAVPTLIPFRECTIDESFDCFFTHMAANSMEGSTYAQNECLDPCDGFDYVESSVSITAFPAESNIQGLADAFRSNSYFNDVIDCPKNASLFHECVKNFIAVDIFFPTMTIDVITLSEAQPLFTLIGNVGGLLGLWTGMCMMTLVQIVYYIIFYIPQLCYRNKNRRKTDSLSWIQSEKRVAFAM